MCERPRGSRFIAPTRVWRQPVFDHEISATEPSLDDTKVEDRVWLRLQSRKALPGECKSLLHEAKVSVAQKLPIAALVIAGAVLESALELFSQERYARHMAEIE